MKHRISFAISYICLLALCTLGAWELLFAEREYTLSASENRMLQGFPAFSLSAVADGSYMEQFDAFLSDAFPGRDRAVALSQTILNVFGGESDEDVEAARRAELDAPSVPEVTAAPSAEPAAEAPVRDEQTYVPAVEEAPSEPVNTQPPSDQDASIWLIDFNGNVEIQETYPIDKLRVVAKVLDMYRGALPEDGQVHFIHAPCSYMFKSLYYKRKADWGSDLDEVLQSLVGEGMYIYDETEILGDSVYNEAVYSLVGDHHWFPRGAWRTVNAMIENCGIPTTDYYEYLYHKDSDFHGEPYTQAQLEGLSVETAGHDIQTQIPISPVESYIVKRLTELSPSSYMDDNRFEHYAIYLGGRRGPYRLFVTGYHTGRNALVIGDSFYQAFIPYLTPYYDNVLATDPRDEMYNLLTIGPDISTYIKQYDIDDIYFVTCQYTSINGYVFQNRLAKYLYLDSAS